MALDDIIATMRSTRTALSLAAPPSQPGVYALFLVKDARLAIDEGFPRTTATDEESVALITLTVD